METHREPPDEQLMNQVARGRRDLLETLLRRHANAVLTFVQRMIGDRHRSEELFQEVFLAVWVRRRTYQFPRPFRAWLFGIAANKCREEYRRAAPLAVELTDDGPLAVVAAGPSPAEAAVAAETASMVATAIARLPVTQRTVVVLRIWNGLSYREIGQIVECQEATVRSHMHHALTAVRKYLEPRMR